MKRWAVALTAVLATGVAITAAADTASATPTQPAPAITNDPNASNGTLAFYDASGNRLTGGSNLNHLFDYALASAPGRAGATKATLYFAFPDHTQSDSQNWVSQQQSPSTTFPNANAPSSLANSTDPLVSLSAADGDLNDAKQGLAPPLPDTTAGYDGIVQVRVYDTGPGVPFDSAHFWASDIYYDPTAGTWQQVYPATATATITSLTASPTGGAQPGALADFIATVTPATAVGSVDFKNGTANLGSIAVSNGTADLQTNSLTTGLHSITATFVPTSTSAFSGSMSTALPYTVADLPDPPTAVQVLPGVDSATVSWTPPASDGGSPVIGYDVRYSSDGGLTYGTASLAFHTSTAVAQTVTRLRGNTSYLFEVAAINAVGTGAYSTPSAPTTVKAPDAVTFFISRNATIVYGHQATILGHLVDETTHRNMAGVTVRLFGRVNLSQPMNAGPLLTTNASGLASYVVKPPAKRFYSWRYAGDATHVGASSPVQTLSVSQTVSIAVTPRTVRRGQTVRIYGVVAPIIPGTRVELQQFSGGRPYNHAAAITRFQRLPNGRLGVGYAFPVRLAKPGRFAYRVIQLGSATLAPGVSGVIVTIAS